MHCTKKLNEHFKFTSNIEMEVGCVSWCVQYQNFNLQRRVGDLTEMRDGLKHILSKFKSNNFMQGTL